MHQPIEKRFLLLLFTTLWALGMAFVWWATS